MVDELTETIEDAEDEAEDEEGDDEDEDIEYQEMTRGFGYRLMNPINLIMFVLACVIDGAQAILFIIGLAGAASGAIPAIMAILGFILDLCALFTIGLWLMFKTGTAVITKRMLKTGKEMAAKGAAAAAEGSEEMANLISKATKWGKHLKWIRFIAPLTEMIPYAVGGWVIAVYAEIKYGE